METLVIIIIVQAFIFGAFSSFIAKEKNRDQAGWFFLGFFFSFIALLALIAVPKLDMPKEHAQPIVPAIPPSPPVSEATKHRRLFFIFIGIVLLFVVAYLLKFYN
jgi:drug/metabolite transporter (DMT)-like permease